MSSKRGKPMLNIGKRLHIVFDGFKDFMNANPDIYRKYIDTWYYGLYRKNLISMAKQSCIDYIDDIVIENDRTIDLRTRINNTPGDILVENEVLKSLNMGRKYYQPIFSVLGHTGRKHVYDGVHRLQVLVDNPEHRNSYLMMSIKEDAHDLELFIPSIFFQSELYEDVLSNSDHENNIREVYNFSIGGIRYSKIVVNGQWMAVNMITATTLFTDICSYSRFMRDPIDFIMDKNILKEILDELL